MTVNFGLLRFQLRRNYRKCNSRSQTEINETAKMSSSLKLPKREQVSLEYVITENPHEPTEMVVKIASYSSIASKTRDLHDTLTSLKSRFRW